MTTRRKIERTVLPHGKTGLSDCLSFLAARLDVTQISGSTTIEGSVLA